MLKTILWYFLALSAASVACSADTTGDDISRNADQYLQALSESGRFSGTVLLARDGQTLFVKGYGFADEKAQFPTRRRRVFRLRPSPRRSRQRWSSSCRNVAHSRSPIRCANTWSPARRPGSPSRSATCSCTPPVSLNFASAPDFESRSRTRRSAGEFIATFRDLPLEFAPGARYHYSNSGYFLLGTILEKVSGKTYATLLADFDLLKPLGMNDSGCLTAVA